MSSAVVSISTLLTSALVFSAATAQSSGQCDINDLKTSYPAPVAADGWTYRLIGSGLSRPRGILFDAEDALLVVEQGSGIVHIEFEDKGQTCLRVRKKTTLLKNKDLTHGIALSEDGRTLYASTRSDVYSWPYDASGPSLTKSSRRTLVAKMDNAGSHPTRTLLLSRKQPGMLVISLGSGSNEDEAALDRSTGISQIRAFNITALGNKDDPYDYTDGTVLGWGLRNSVGLGEHPETGGIWSVENSVDNLHRQGRDIHTDNPGEELNFHGYLNGSDEDQGGNYGYPLCYTIWSTENFPDQGNLTIGDQFPPDLDFGSDVSVPSDSGCNADYVPPVLPFQAHTAPLDIKFDNNGTQAFISFHGSWNRREPVGYDVSLISFDGKTGRPSDTQKKTDAATPIVYNTDLSKCPDDCFRPVGLAWDSTGRLWFSSDSTGEIFVLERNGNNGSNSDGGQGGGGSGGNDDDSATSQLTRPELAGLALIVAAAIGFSLT